MKLLYRNLNNLQVLHLSLEFSTFCDQCHCVSWFIIPNFSVNNAIVPANV